MKAFTADRYRTMPQGATFNRSVAEVVGAGRDKGEEHPQATLHFVPLRLKVPPDGIVNRQLPQPQHVLHVV